MIKPDILYSAGNTMTNLLGNFDSEKDDLSKRIAAAPSIEDVVKLTDRYLTRLHRDMTDVLSLQKSRQAGYLLEILRYAIRTLTAVDKNILMADLRPWETLGGPVSKRLPVFEKTIPSALILALLAVLLSIDPIPWIPVLLVIVLLGTEIYRHVFAWRTRALSKRAATCIPPDEKPQIDAQLKISRVHTFMNCIADALSYADKALIDPTSEKGGSFLEKDPQILKLFQDLFEARAFHDGEWALKKVNHIQAILWEQGIVVKEFDPSDATDIASFDIEPGADPSITQYVTIRPAFLKNGRALLRGQVAEPFSPARQPAKGLQHP
jgi:hypothetical protein